MPAARNHDTPRRAGARVEKLAAEVEALEQTLALLRTKEARQDEFLQQLVRDVAQLSSGIASVAEQGQPVSRTTFEIIARGVLFATVGAIVGGALGGPAIALVLHEPVAGKMIEGAISGALGAAASEVAGLLDPFDRPEPSIGSSVGVDISKEEEKQNQEEGRQKQKGK
jgi:hypothetical protein